MPVWESRCGDRPNSASIALFRAFGDDYFTFMFGGVQFVAINSQLYKDATDAAAEPRRRTNGAWGHIRSRAAPTRGGKEEQHSRSDVLEQTLDDLASPQHVVAFSHIPPFIESQDEPSAYFNLEQGVGASAGGPVRGGLLGVVLRPLPQEQAASTRLWTEPDDDRLGVVVSSAIGTP